MNKNDCNFINLFCCVGRHIKKRNDFIKSGYTTIKPFDYSPQKYGYIKTHKNIFDVGVYYKYGPVYYIF